MLNYVLLDRWGSPMLWPDGAYPQWGIALQYDGLHHADPDQHLRTWSPTTGPRPWAGLKYAWAGGTSKVTHPPSYAWSARHCKAAAGREMADEGNAWPQHCRELPSRGRVRGVTQSTPGPLMARMEPSRKRST